MKKWLRNWLGIEDFESSMNSKLEMQNKINEVRLEAVSKTAADGLKKIADYVGYVDDNEWEKYGGPQ